MKQELEIKKVEFGIQEIQILQFSLDSSPQHQALDPKHPYTFEINAGGLVDSSLKLLGVNFNVKIFAIPQKEDKVCELTLRMSFKIVNFEEVVRMDGDKVDVPDLVMQHLIAVTLSTTRGILFEKLQGSFLSQIILPIFNVSQFHKINTEV
jgi:hypothetical protein